MRRIVFDLPLNKDYTVIQVIPVFRDDEDGAGDLVGHEPRVILETASLDKARRLVYQIATDDHTREGEWYRPTAASGMTETYIQAKNGRVVKRFIPYRF